MGILSKTPSTAHGSQTPAEAPPSYHEAAANEPQVPYRDAKQVQPATSGERPLSHQLGRMHKFPESFNLYGPLSPTARWKGLWHLGPSQEQKLFTLATGKPFQHEVPALYEGPDAKGILIGSVQIRDELPLANMAIVVYPHPGCPLKGPLDIRVGGAYNLIHPFDVPVSDDGRVVDRFAWLKSKGEEVRQLHADSRGWKLVRIPPEQAGSDGSVVRPNVNAHDTYDDLEMVAVAASNMVQVKSLTKYMKFSFTGRGATGAFGEVWEAAVVLAFLQLYELDCMNIANASVPRDPLQKDYLAGSGNMFE